MKKIEITNRSDATEQFACILVAEAFGKYEENRNTKSF